MVIQHIGHAEFLLTLEEGIRIVTDPYDANCGYPIVPTEADVVLVSHHHSDHDAVENVTGQPRIIDKAGTYTLSPDARLTAVHSFHDDAGGAKRGENLLFLLEAEGLRVAHLGDLGTELTPEQRKALGRIDVLMIPVGGFFTIDAAQAKQVAESLEAKIIIPMHYKTSYNQDWPIAGPEAFLAQFSAEEVETGGEALRVALGDLGSHPRVVQL